MEPSASSLSDTLAGSSLAVQYFRFFDLPSELRFKIWGFVLVTEQIVDLHPQNFQLGRKLLNIFLTSHRFHEEAYPVFYGGHTLRIFPTHDRFFGHKVQPLVARLWPRYRAALVSLELRLGPGWSNPPRSWRVDNRLGLEEMAAVRTLKVFVECDPSHDMFKGFRLDKAFFTDFSGNLLRGVIQRLPSMTKVEIDGWPSVLREGPLVKRLLEVATEAEKMVVVNEDEDAEQTFSIRRARKRHNYPIELD